MKNLRAHRAAVINLEIPQLSGPIFSGDQNLVNNIFGTTTTLKIRVSGVLEFPYSSTSGAAGAAGELSLVG